ncbi:MAG: efflux RND transporter permease subunit [Muribaculaceae bacterium]|nr:efflux RND transporter permease subunit [Muribaculaceae bacterium]
MLDRIIRTSLGARMAVLIMAGLVMMCGVAVMMRTQVDIFPDLNAPTVVVMTEAPGMAPEEIEKGVTYPIETSVNGAEGVRRVRSQSSTGFSVVWVEFDWDTDVYRARQIVSERLSGLAGEMPPGVGTPTLGPQSSILGEMLIIGLSSDSITGGEELRTIADRLIAPRLLSLPGVSNVSVIGGEAREYQILLCPAKMQRHGVSIGDVKGAVEGMNTNVTGGVVYEHGNEYLVKADISTTGLEDLSNSVVASGSEGIVRLSDIAEVRTGSEEPRLGTASICGNEAVLVTVTKQPGAGTIELTEEIEEKLQALKKTLPGDVRVDTEIFRQADFIGRSISNLRESLFIGAIFVIIVLFVFLMDVRTTLISLVAIPLSIMVTIIVLDLLGFTINTMSLGGIAIAIGSLVDDAIVDVENVHKRLLRDRPKGGKNMLNTVFEASREVRLPIFNSSLIIMASFLPLFFLDGMEGRMLRPLGISFIVALVASTIVALTVTPVLCSYLLGGKLAERKMAKEPPASRWLAAVYSRALERVLANPRPVLVTTGVLFVVSLGLFLTLGRSFLPPFNEGSLTINVSTLPGISLEESDRVGREAEKIILETPEISKTARKTGRAELDEHSLGVNVSEIEAPYTLAGRPKDEMLADLRHRLSHLPGVNIEVGQPISHRIDAMLSGTEAQIAIKLFGDDLPALNRLGGRIRHVVGEVNGVVDVNIEQQMERPELAIKPRRDMLAYYEITLPEFAEFVKVALAGEKVSQVYEDGQPYDLTLRMEPSARSTAADIASLPIDSRVGKIPLAAVAEIESTAGPNSISRENVNRRIVISANVDGRDLRGTVEDIKKAIEDNIELPEGYYVTYGGQFENEAAASRTLGLVSLLSVLIIYMLLYGQYHSMGRSLIIMLNMPLALIGGVLILWLTSGQLNIPAIIGFISLMGIATRNGMLLMSRYDSLMQTGTPLRETVMRGSADRLNPILMTALSSALALIPLAVGGARPGNEIQSPLAIVILGGLLSSTLLNLLVIPVIYTWFAKKDITKGKHNGKETDFVPSDDSPDRTYGRDTV